MCSPQNRTRPSSILGRKRNIGREKGCRQSGGDQKSCQTPPLSANVQWGKDRKKGRIVRGGGELIINRRKMPRKIHDEKRAPFS